MAADVCHAPARLQQWLLDYENDHPEDVTGDTCILCGGSEESATDWISCDSCGSWVRTCCDLLPKPCSALP